MPGGIAAPLRHQLCCSALPADATVSVSASVSAPGSVRSTESRPLILLFRHLSPRHPFLLLTPLIKGIQS